MSDDKKTGTVPKPEADFQAVVASVSRLVKLNGVGSVVLASLLFGALAWFRGELRAVVREEVAPIEKRLQVLEVDQEVEKRIRSRPGSSKE